MGTVPSGTVLARSSWLRMWGMSPPVERSITVSAPYFRQPCSLCSSVRASPSIWLLPMFALILHVARREKLPVEIIRAEVARGRMIIPANLNHPELEPMCIGIAAACKINANIGNSQIDGDARTELHKLHGCLKYGADTVMDLSTGGDIPHIRNQLLRASSVPLR